MQPRALLWPRGSAGSHLPLSEVLLNERMEWQPTNPSLTSADDPIRTVPMDHLAEGCPSGQLSVDVKPLPRTHWVPIEELNFLGFD